MTTTPTPSASTPRSPWPFMITLGLLIVIAVNAWFIYVAVNGRDPVVPSYTTDRR